MPLNPPTGCSGSFISCELEQAILLLVLIALLVPLALCTHVACMVRRQKKLQRKRQAEGGVEEEAPTFADDDSMIGMFDTPAPRRRATLGRSVAVVAVKSALRTIRLIPRISDPSTDLITARRLPYENAQARAKRKALRKDAFVAEIEERELSPLGWMTADCEAAVAQAEAQLQEPAAGAIGSLEWAAEIKLRDVARERVRKCARSPELPSVATARPTPDVPTTLPTPADDLMRPGTREGELLSILYTEAPTSATVVRPQAHPPRRSHRPPTPPIGETAARQRADVGRWRSKSRPPKLYSPCASPVCASATAIDTFSHRGDEASYRRSKMPDAVAKQRHDDDDYASVAPAEAHQRPRHRHRSQGGRGASGGDARVRETRHGRRYHATRSAVLEPEGEAEPEGAAESLPAYADETVAAAAVRELLDSARAALEADYARAHGGDMRSYMHVNARAAAMLDGECRQIL